MKSEDEDLKEVKKPVKYKKKRQKDGKKTAGKFTPKKRKRKKSQEEDEYTQQSGSGSSSGESDESAQFQRRYPIRQRQRRPHRVKFLFNRNKDEEDNEENDVDEDGEESAEEDDENDDLLDDEDVKYVIEKAKMEKLMGASGSHSEENWWDPFDEQKIYQKTMSSYYMSPPPDPTYDPLAADDILSSYGGGEDGGGITGWFSNMFSNIMPSMSWGGGGKKDDDDFKGDPFFTSFDGRSMKNGESRSFSSNNYYNDLKMPTLSSANYLRNVRRGKQIDLGKYFGVRVNSKQLDYVPVSTTGNK